jgi:ribose transport system ATP-binding protein
MQNDLVVRLAGITKRYGMAEVLSGVDFDLRRGEVHGLVGENGAGKSTLMNILYGLVERDEGDIWIEEARLSHVSTKAVKEAGVALIPQKLQMLSNLTVAENIFINNWPGHERLGLVSWKGMEARAEELLGKVNLQIDPGRKMGSLSYVDQQMVVITRMLFAENAHIILLDEPTAPLVEQEVELLFQFIESLKKQGYSFIYISHYLTEVFRLCDRVTVLRDGRVVLTDNIDSLSMGELVTAMVGEDVDLFPARSHDTGEGLFEVRDLVVPPVINGLSFTLRRGEILGIAGLKGSGRTELARAICGLDAMPGGVVSLNGEQLRIKDVRDGLSQGIGYLPEDRINWGLVGIRPLFENATLTFFTKAFSRLGFIKVKEELETVEQFIDLYDIRTTGPKQTTKNLSGGNQQKVVFAKLLGADLNVLFLDEPTFGIDVKAKTHVYRIMNDFVERGNAIVLISSDINEMVEMCDRILVLQDGTIAKAYDRGEITERELQEVLAHDSH